MESRWDGASLSPDRQRLAVLLCDLYEGGVAGDPSGRLGGERRTLLDRAAALARTSEGGCVHVHDHLVALYAPPAAPIDGRERRFRHRGECLRARRAIACPRFR